jgi:tetratricopeptide (TPR) repeat protein
MMKRKGALTQGKEIKLMLEAGCVYRYAGKFREAREIFQGVRALLPSQAVADLALAGLYVDENKLSEAELHCKRALELNRASAPAYTQLAEIQLLQKNMGGARQSLKKAMEISPSGPAAVQAKTLLKLASMLEAKS